MVNAFSAGADAAQGAAAQANYVVEAGPHGLLSLEQWAFIAGIGMFLSFVMILFTLIRGVLKANREKKARAAR